MIKNSILKANNVETNGFVATYENNVLSFSGGSLVLGEEPYNYPDGFSFDVIGDIEVPVSYDVYLTKLDGKPNIAVSRVEMLGGLPQSMVREPNEELIHLLCSFMIPANSTEFDIEVRLFERMAE